MVTYTLYQDRANYGHRYFIPGQNKLWVGGGGAACCYSNNIDTVLYIRTEHIMGTDTVLYTRTEHIMGTDTLYQNRAYYGHRYYIPE